MQKLANLHGPTPAGIEWHRKLISLGGPVSSLSTSYVAVARHEMDSPDGVADLALADLYLNKVIMSHAPDKEGAEEMLRELRIRQARAL
jgi:anaphase-promoting complex subunit 8